MVATMVALAVSLVVRPIGKPVGASGTLGILALIALLNVAGVVALRLCSRSLPSATVAS